MTTTEVGRRATRQVVTPDLPAFDASDLDISTRSALAELLLTMADDEFVIGFWDSEWTGIAPMLEEDVAFSSLAQDEIGHARLWYEMLAQLTGDDPDRIAFGRAPDDYHHAALLDHPRTDWAFSVARRWLYDTADAVRLGALKAAAWQPLADAVAKVRREERYHLMHLDTWMRRLAEADGPARDRLQTALDRLAPSAASVLSTLPAEAVLTGAGILGQPMAALADRWRDQVHTRLVGDLGLRFDAPPATADGRPSEHGVDFGWLWSEFTMVYRSDPEATW